MNMQRDDYQNICKQHNFSIHKSITDIGGSLGALINIIYKNNPNLKCFLFDKPEVIRLIKSEKIETIKGDFFENIPNLSDAIIMSRVIHDWNNEKAQIILQNVYKALPKNGTLYLLPPETSQLVLSSD